MLLNTLKGASRIIALVLAGTVASAPAYAEDKVVVAHSTTSFAFLTFFVAEAMNYFDETGVVVEDVRTGSGSKAMAAMVNGDANIYIGSTATAFKSRAKGVPVKLIAPVVRQLTTSIVVSEEWSKKHNITKDSPLDEKLAALKGARIAVSGPGSGGDQTVRYVAAEAGLNPDRDMEIVAMGSNSSTYMSAMNAGQIDGFAISPPAIHVAEKEFNSTILVNLAAGELPSMDGYFYIGMLARDDWYSQNLDAAARVIKGLKMAMDAVHDPELNPKAAQATYEKFYSDMDRELFQRVWDDQSNSVPSDLSMDTETVTAVIDFYNRFAETPISADLIPETVTSEVTDAAMALK